MMQLRAVALAVAATFVVSVTSSDSPQIDVRFTCGNDEKSCHVILGNVTRQVFSHLNARLNGDISVCR